jgi:hypothetical protein
MKRERVPKKYSRNLRHAVKTNEIPKVILGKVEKTSYFCLGKVETLIFIFIRKVEILC